MRPGGEWLKVLIQWLLYVIFSLYKSIKNPPLAPAYRQAGLQGGEYVPANKSLAERVLCIEYVSSFIA
jgi:hypothetical protein